jgi:glycosyltransferase involved in cell wall biosynthesis
MPKATIVLPAFNVAEHLREVLRAVTQQHVEGVDVELVLVDNNSTDATVEIAREFPAVRLVHESKQGSYAARNRGVRESSGDIVVFLDPDCAPRPGWLAAALRGFEDPRRLIVEGRRFYRPSRLLALLSKYEDEKIQWILRNGCADQIYAYTNNMAVRRTILEQYGPFPERMRGGDTMFVQRVVVANGAGCVGFVPAMAVDHLEVRRLSDYYRKCSVYGASNERLSREVPFRPLSSAQRFSVVGSLVARGRVAPWSAMILLALLVPGAIAYERASQGAP